ncbi:MAG: hypothetical protein M1823_004542 [Watsoniomyces obsoletus]|nr:MAG: hypothetical protein M1823_004542 [Watsoniomyces obsoletus]
MSHASTADEVWGVAYHITPSRVEEVKEYLDIREINGYTIHEVPFYPADDHQSPIRTIAYIGTPENPQFTGPQDPPALAEHIWKSRGPSGDNKDYLLKLDESLDQLSPDSGDGHVKELATIVRALEAGSTATKQSQRNASIDAPN